MTKLIMLFLVFFKIGLFSFGGGYAMLPMIQSEITKHGWISADEFSDIIAITGITPGSIAVNSATFVGQHTVGLLGGLVATFGVVLPSFILVLIVCKVFFKFSNHPIKNAAFYCIRPAVIGMILSAAFSVAETSLFKVSIDFAFLQKLFTNAFSAIDIKSIIIFIAALVLLLKTKINPILVLVFSALVGIVIF